jgi:hypothetical protein
MEHRPDLLVSVQCYREAIVREESWMGLREKALCDQQPHKTAFKYYKSARLIQEIGKNFISAKTD